MKRGGARTRTWTVTLTNAEWELAEAVRRAVGGNLGMSRAEFVRWMVEENAKWAKERDPAVAAALEGLEKEYGNDQHASRVDRGGRPPSTRWELPADRLPKRSCGPNW